MVKTRTIPRIDKLYRMNIWTLRAIQLAMLQEGVSNETEFVHRIIRQVLKHKKCKYAKNYKVERKKKRIKFIEVWCQQHGNFVNFRNMCLKICLLGEFKRGSKTMTLVDV